MQHRVQAGLASRLTQFMKHLFPGSSHSARMTIPPSGWSHRRLVFSRSRQLQPSIRISNATMIVAKCFTTLLRIRARVEAVTVTPVARHGIASTACHTSGPKIFTAVAASLRLQRTVLSLRCSISSPCVSLILVWCEWRPRTTTEHKKVPQSLIAGAWQERVETASGGHKTLLNGTQT